MKTIALVLGLLAMVTLAGCTAASQQRFGQAWQKEIGGGYLAIVKLYSLDGKLLETWEGSHVIADSDDDGDPSLTFIKDGKKISISGVYSIEER